jgi:RNA polymerase sigma factor (TIGR02999 family)
MHEVTKILAAMEQGQTQATEQLLPLVYDELRRLAAGRLACEAPGQTLQPTALVHEAYLRLVGSPLRPATGDQAKPGGYWDSRAHFFAAAAEAMRRILVENARRKKAARHGGELRRVAMDDLDLAVPGEPDELLLLDEALMKLAQEDAAAATLVKLRYFSGLSVEEAAEMAGLARATAYRHWSFARAWLLARMKDHSE